MDLVSIISRYGESRAESLRDRHPEAYEKVVSGAGRLAAGKASDDWQSVGLSCRDAHISFANSVYSPDFLPAGENEPAADHSNRRIELTIRHFGQLGGSDELRDVVKKLWTYAVRLQHDNGATEEDAGRCLTLTTLALGELAEMISQAVQNEDWVKEYGVYKCPTCGSTGLREDWIVEYDGAWKYLDCTKCVWSSLFQ